MYKQLIIARKDLNMSPGKLAAQVSHASIAFLLEKILWGSKEVVRERDGIMYHMDISLDTDLFHDYFLIYDACRTELEKESPEGTLTCIGFRPMEAEEIDKIGKKYQLYH
jgi:PTH2 family peptidyl-tRNA hydrolase